VLSVSLFFVRRLYPKLPAMPQQLDSINSGRPESV
jgi:hypothetical protein